MHGALSSALWIQGLGEQKIFFSLDSTLKSPIEIPTQAQLMVVIEGKQKEAAATEEVVSKALPKNISPNRWMYLIWQWLYDYATIGMKKPVSFQDAAETAKVAENANNMKMDCQPDTKCYLWRCDQWM